VYGFYDGVRTQAGANSGFTAGSGPPTNAVKAGIIRRQPDNS
jgi:hypothetical protein